MSKNKLTIGDRYEPAMQIQDEAEARAYFEDLVKQVMDANPKLDRTEVERIERSNLGYYAGYFDPSTQERVNRLFNTQHPIFGANTNPTAEEAFEAGLREAKKYK